MKHLQAFYNENAYEIVEHAKQEKKQEKVQML